MVVLAPVSLETSVPPPGGMAALTGSGVVVGVGLAVGVVVGVAVWVGVLVGVCVAVAVGVGGKGWAQRATYAAEVRPALLNQPPT